MAENYGSNVTNLASDNLVAGESKLVEQAATLLAGLGALVRGTVLAKVTKGAAVAAKVSGTGDGVLGAVTLKAKAKVGVYRLVCIAASANAGTFAVYDPDGYRMADLTVAVAYDNGHIALTIADGAEDWGVGAVVTVTVAAGSGKYVKYAAAAVNGAALPRAILGRDIEVGDTDAKAFVYVAGEFNREALTGIDDAAVGLLEDRGIFVR